jgi:hypothetical protein
MKKNKVSRRVCTAGIDVYETYLFRLGALYAEIPPPLCPAAEWAFWLFSHSSLKFYFIFLVCLPCPFDMSALVYM